MIKGGSQCDASFWLVYNLFFVFFLSLQKPEVDKAEALACIFLLSCVLSMFERKQRSSQVSGTLWCSSASTSNTLHFDWAFYGSIATIAW